MNSTKFSIGETIKDFTFAILVSLLPLSGSFFYFYLGIYYDPDVKKNTYNWTLVIYASILGIFGLIALGLPFYKHFIKK
jgi:hypothetical protein